jgi:hypothetical protein
MSTADAPKEESHDTNVGAIVGGVVGGLALIAFVAFGVWFIRFQKRKEARRAKEVHPYVGLTGNDKPGPQQPYSPTDYGSVVTPKKDYGTPYESPPTFQQSYPMQPIEVPDRGPVEAPSVQRFEAPDDNYHRIELAS